MWHFGKPVKKLCLKLWKKETVGRWVYGLRQLLMIFGGVALVNWQWGTDQGKTAQYVEPYLGYLLLER